VRWEAGLVFQKNTYPPKVKKISLKGLGGIQARIWEPPGTLRTKAVTETRRETVKWRKKRETLFKKIKVGGKLWFVGQFGIEKPETKNMRALGERKEARPGGGGTHDPTVKKPMKISTSRPTVSGEFRQKRELQMMRKQ